MVVIHLRRFNLDVRCDLRWTHGKQSLAVADEDVDGPEISFLIDRSMTYLSTWSPLKMVVTYVMI